jgi:hypothetical protein
MVKEAVGVLHAAATFLSRPDFLVNFVANLGGALCGVLLAFWIEHRRTRRDATNLYGRLLSTSRSELSYLRPMCAKQKDDFRAVKLVTPLGSFSVPATRALLVNPLVQEKAPYSLIMALTILSAAVDTTEDALRQAKTLISGKLSPEMAANYGKALGDEMEQVERLMEIALERLNLELERLGIALIADAQTQEVSRRLLEVVQKRGRD